MASFIAFSRRRMATFRSRDLNAVWWIFIATWLLFFSGNIVGNRYTGWDTHGLGFTNFLYFVDALRSFSLPLWNPLIQGGTLHANIFNVGNYTPFQWIFVALSYVVNPLYAYELMIQATVLLGAIGFYLFLRDGGNDRDVSLFGAQAFFLSTLMPITGQLGFIFSLGSLPWLLLVCRGILVPRQQIGGWVLVFWAAMIASFMVSGYPWMNVVNSAITFFYACNLIWINRKTLSGSNLWVRSRCCLGFLAAVAGVLVCYYLPGYLSMKFNYQQFAGDFISPEPRLRGLAATWHMKSPGLKEALISAIDPRILMLDAQRWSWGTGLVVWMALFYKKAQNGFVRNNLLWILLAIFWLAYSSGTIGSITGKVPLLSANRWWAIGQNYVSICLILLAVSNLQHGASQTRDQHLNGPHFVVASACLLSILFYFAAPALLVLLAICAIGFFYCLASADTEGGRREALILLMCLNVAAFISVPAILHGTTRSQLSILSQAPDNYKRRVENRVKPVNITVNPRQIETATEYVADDESWLLNKTSYNHGYNPLGNPLHWYLKSDDFTRNLVYITRAVRLEQPLSRSNFASDNAYVDALIKDVRSNETVPTVDHLHDERPQAGTDRFQWSLKELKQEPNRVSIKVSTTGAGYLMFNNTYFPGWEVFVNGTRADIIKVNRIFMGVYLEKGGENEITFKFFPASTVALLLFPSLVMLCSLIILSVRRGNPGNKVLFFSSHAIQTPL